VGIIVINGLDGRRYGCQGSSELYIFVLLGVLRLRIEVRRGLDGWSIVEGIGQAIVGDDKVERRTRPAARCEDSGGSYGPIHLGKALYRWSTRKPRCGDAVAMAVFVGCRPESPRVGEWVSFVVVLNNALVMAADGL